MKETAADQPIELIFQIPGFLVFLLTPICLLLDPIVFANRKVLLFFSDYSIEFALYENYAVAAYLLIAVGFIAHFSLYVVSTRYADVLRIAAYILILGSIVSALLGLTLLPIVLLGLMSSISSLALIATLDPISLLTTPFLISFLLHLLGSFLGITPFFVSVVYLTEGILVLWSVNRIGKYVLGRGTALFLATTAIVVPFITQIWLFPLFNLR